MIVVGLTGSIGMGKSTVAAMFADEGVPVFDADAVVHEMQQAGGQLVHAIGAAFPGCVSDAGIDRAMLGALVFGDPDKLRQLEAIVHPEVDAARQAFLAENRNAPMLVFDIPLLLENGRSPDIDAVVVVSAPGDVQRARVLTRRDMTTKKFDNIVALQMPDAEKRARADHVIDTGTTLAVTQARVREVIACLTATKGSSSHFNA
jgi:dephospho-CoA kinase